MASNLTINWSGTTTGNTVTNYTLVYFTGNTTPIIISGIPSGTTSYTITGLDVYSSYSGYVFSNCYNCYTSTTLNWSVPSLGCRQTIVNFTGQTGMTVSLGIQSGWSILEVSGTTITPSNSGCTRFDIYYPSYNPSNPSLNKITNIGNGGHPFNNNGIYYVYFYYTYNGSNTNIFIKYNPSPDGCS